MNTIKSLLICVCLVVVFNLALGQEQNDAKVAQKLDAFGYGSGMGKVLSECDVTARLDNFAHFLEQDPSSRGYIISYKGKGKTPRSYPHQLGWQYGWLTDARGIAKNRVVAVSGGYRNEPSVELWIVPDGAEVPKPSPTFIPKKRKRR